MGSICAVVYLVILHTTVNHINILRSSGYVPDIPVRFEPDLEILDRCS